MSHFGSGLEVIRATISMRCKIVYVALMALALGATVATFGKSAAALTINPIYDETISGLSNAAAVERAFDSAAAAYVGAFSNPVTVNVQVSWGRVGSYRLSSSAVGASIEQLYGYYTYNQVRSLLQAAAKTKADRSAVFHLPGSAPLGVASYVIPSANAKALGIIDANGAAMDGAIGFAGDSVLGYTYTGADIILGTHDFVAVAEHELAEVLGRISGLRSSAPLWRTPLDLFRFQAPGTLSFSYNEPAYLSANGGTTALNNYNHSSTGGDRGDWLTTSTTRDVQDAFILTGEHAIVSAADLTALDLIGWTGTSEAAIAATRLAGATNVPNGLSIVPEPGDFGLVVLSFILVYCVKWKE